MKKTCMHVAPNQPLSPSSAQLRDARVNNRALHFIRVLQVSKAKVIYDRANCRGRASTGGFSLQPLCLVELDALLP